MRALQSTGRRDGHGFGVNTPVGGRVWPTPPKEPDTGRAVAVPGGIRARKLKPLI